MKIKFIKLLLFFLVFIISSCSKSYYVGYSLQDVKLYSIPDTTMSYSSVIPSNKLILIKKEISTNVYYVIYENKVGYIYNTNFYHKRKYNYSIDGQVYGYSTYKRKDKKIINSRYYTTPSNYYYSPSKGGPVHVRGYYRKNGTYVRPYTRRSPRRR